MRNFEKVEKKVLEIRLLLGSIVFQSTFIKFTKILSLWQGEDEIIRSIEIFDSPMDPPLIILWQESQMNEHLQRVKGY